MSGQHSLPPVTAQLVPLPRHLGTNEAVAALVPRFAGPALIDGPLPAVLYLALCSEESLTLDPFNQPVVFLQGQPIRVFSLTLPGHGPGFDKTQAVAYWAERFAAGDDLLTKFLKGAIPFIDYLAEAPFVRGPVAAAGLSRGGYAAMQLAAATPHIGAVCSFAPLTRLSFLGELQEALSSPERRHWDLWTHLDALSERHLAFFIGNRDQRVGTRHCFELVDALVDTASQKGIRSVPIELKIYPSIGHKGHGTPAHIFHAGARWLARQCNIE